MSTPTQPQGRQRTCAICLLDKDVRNEVDEMLRAMPAHTQIKGWLRDIKKVTTSVAVIKYHYYSDHHLENL